MTPLRARLEGADVGEVSCCDTSLADGSRYDEVEAAALGVHIVGRWPDAFENEAIRHCVRRLGDDAAWATLAATPAFAANVQERAALVPLDRAIVDLLPNLQHVCRHPRMHLRVEEERLPISRARRTPARAIADLVSHPGDWEHRTLKSIQPARVLTRTLEDEWSIYENVVAARLVDHLLAYLARRLEELRRIERSLDEGRDHSDEARTSFWRARRLMTLWGSVGNKEFKEKLEKVIECLEGALRDVQVLLGSLLYAHVPRRAAVGLELKATNVLLNDPYYRKVARLWRLWVRHGHQRHETRPQRLARRQHEGDAWDRFVLLVVARALDQLGWSGEASGRGWVLRRPGFASLQLEPGDVGVIHLRTDGGDQLRILPACADLGAAEPAALSAWVSRLDVLAGEVVVAHVGRVAPLEDVDRATGWSFGGTATLFALSPWLLDSEERMRRLLAGWASRAARPTYPSSLSARGLSSLPSAWEWVVQRGANVLKLRSPREDETAVAVAWFAEQERTLDAEVEIGKRLKGGADPTSLRAVRSARTFVTAPDPDLGALADCPVCGRQGRFEVRAAGGADASRATWWATCECGSAWGLRSCTVCSGRYPALSVAVSRAASVTAAGRAEDWPDRQFGSDVWAQPCATDRAQFRCPDCGTCGHGTCGRCAL